MILLGLYHFTNSAGLTTLQLKYNFKSNKKKNGLRTHLYVFISTYQKENK